MPCINPGKRGSGTPCGLGVIRTSSLFMTTRSLIACTRRSLRHRPPPVPTSSTCFEVHTHSTSGPREGIKDKVLTSVPNSSPEQVHCVNTPSDCFRVAKNNRSKSVWTLFQRKRLNNQTVWPVIFGLTGPICARALKSLHPLELRPRGHHDWPVKPTNRDLCAWCC